MWTFRKLFLPVRYARYGTGIGVAAWPLLPGVGDRAPGKGSTRALFCVKTTIMNALYFYLEFNGLDCLLQEALQVFLCRN